MIDAMGLSQMINRPLPLPGSVVNARRFARLHWRRIFVMAGIACMSVASHAARLSNSFLTIDGDGVSIDGDGSIVKDGTAAGPVLVTARPGWLVNGRGSVNVSSPNVSLRGLSVKSSLGEDEEHVHVFPCSTGDKHLDGFEISAKAEPENVIAIYAIPDKRAAVSATAKEELVNSGSHSNVVTYSSCSCGVAHDPTETGEVYTVAPDHYDWVASAMGLAFPLPMWSGYMTKGLGQSIKFEVTGTRDGCAQCKSTAKAEASADVHELSIARPDYVGIDMTDAMKGKYVTREASAIINPGAAKTSYSWLDCGKCEFVGDKDGEKVTYGATNETEPSAAFLAESLTVSATVENAEGMSASANCTTNFTIVKVDVVIDGVGEENEETEGAFLPYVADKENGAISVDGTNKMVSVSFSCMPQNLPTNEVVSITSGGPGELYEVLANGELVVIMSTNYPACDINNHVFKLHGHEGSNQLRDGRVEIYHANSHAVDEAAYTIVGIKTETVATTPTDRARKTIGVGEEVTATICPSSLSPVAWSVTGGGSIDRSFGNLITFTATNRASTAIITAESNGLHFGVLLTVIEPDGVSMRRLSSKEYPPGLAGAGMYTEISLCPTTVSFYNVETLEMPGPASDVTGYFTNFPVSVLFHNPSPDWGDYNQSNVFQGYDDCATPPLPAPWSDGGFVWYIPWHFRVGGADNGKPFTVVDQRFVILADGTVEVRKAGASVSRVP